MNAQQRRHSPVMVGMDPRTGLLLFIIASSIIYATRPAGTVWMWVWLICARLVTRQRSLQLSDFLPRSVALLAFFSLITHALCSPAPYLVEWGVIRVSASGIARGALLAVRLLLTAAAAKLLAETTSPLGLASALRWLLHPLEYIGLSLPDLPMLMAIGARFVPELHLDARRLVTLWRLRHTGDQRASRKLTLTSIGHELLVPLFRLSWRRATTLGEALALRHYTPRGQPTLPPYRLSAADRWAWGGTLGFCVLVFFAS
jgi:energy-coupling factor transporter transmembrane protein EcfT